MTGVTEPQELLSAESLAYLRREIASYPTAQAAVKSALRLAQKEHGWLSTEVMDYVARLLDIEPIRVYEVATFYDMFDTRPVGRHKLRVCTSVSCMLCGSDAVVERLRERLGIGFGETTADGRFTLEEAECLSACGGAPVILAGDDYHELLTPEGVDRLLDGLE